MARFILDVANLTETEIEEVISEVVSSIEMIGHGVITMNCIDSTNKNQFHTSDDGVNNLTEAQINTHNVLSNQ